MLRSLYGCACLRYLASAVAFGARRPVGAPALASGRNTRGRTGRAPWAPSKRTPRSVTRNGARRRIRTLVAAWIWFMALRLGMSHIAG